MVLLWAGSGSLALAKEVSLSPDLGGKDTSKLGDFPPPDLKITPPDGDTLSIVGSLSDHGSAASAKLHEEINGHKASNTAPLHWVQFNCPPEHRDKITMGI